MLTNRVHVNAVREKLAQVKNKLTSLKLLHKQVVDAAMSHNTDKVSALNSEVENVLKHVEALVTSAQSQSFKIK
jgi:hypothetical protein